MTNVWPDLEGDRWYGSCPRCGEVVGPCVDAVEAEVEADTHCLGEGGGVSAIVNSPVPPGNLYAEVS